MGSRDRNPQGGRGALRAVMVLVTILAVSYGAYKLIPWAWHGGHQGAAGIRAWWQVRVADPVFQGLIHVLLITRGQALAALVMIAFAYWLFNRALASVSIISFRSAAKQQQLMQENIIGQMENVQSKLKKLFADDIEKIALFGGSVSSGQADSKSGSSLPIGCFGCLTSLLWLTISVPLVLMIGIAAYDGLLRLFVTTEPLDSLLTSAGSHAEELSEILPIERSVSLVGILTVNLADRSLVLTSVLCAVGFAAWFIKSISKSGWTFPRFDSFSPLFIFLVSIVLCYFFLNSALLIFAICFVAYSLFSIMLTKFLFRPLYLRVRPVIALRVRPTPKPAEDHAHATV